MPKTPIIKSNDDIILWQRVVSRVTPLKSKIQSGESSALFAVSGAHEKPLSKDYYKRSNQIGEFTKNLSKGGLDRPDLIVQQKKPADLRQGERAGVDGRTQKRLFRGEVLVDRRIDLHGLTAARAERHLQQFVETAAYEGCRCLLVITGKGAGVLRSHVPNWLKQPPLSPHVLALAEARPKDGGGGAFYVLLRRKRNG